MKAIILEDEKLSADYLITLLKRIQPEIEIIGVYDSVAASIDVFQQTLKVDILFADIHLADGISFDLFSKVEIEIPVIFTTAYDEYAIKAFKLNSIDYLLKPIGVSELKVALDKFEKIQKNHTTQQIQQVASNYVQQSSPYKNRFLVKIGDAILPIKAEEIIHFISEDGMVFLVTKQGKRHPIDFNLDQLERVLDPALFFRINRKVIIELNAVQKVVSYFNSRLKIKSDVLEEEACIVSRERVAAFKNWLDGN
jgi:DNA-binding LytR/AlgR family response regulator